MTIHADEGQVTRRVWCYVATWTFKLDQRREADLSVLIRVNGRLAIMHLSRALTGDIDASLPFTDC